MPLPFVAMWSPSIFSTQRVVDKWKQTIYHILLRWIAYSRSLSLQWIFLMYNFSCMCWMRGNNLKQSDKPSHCYEATFIIIPLYISTFSYTPFIDSTVTCGCAHILISYKEHIKYNTEIF